MPLDEASDLHFSFEDILPPEQPHVPKKQEICADYQRGKCTRGTACPQRHIISSFRTVQPKVCKHWLRGACVNGENCLYLHSYETRFVPVCAFYERLGECANPECPFTHDSPIERQPECAAYKRGFCPLGPQCKLRHVFIPKACPFYLAGFCPLGPRCPWGHPVQQLYDRMSISHRILSEMLITRAHDPTFNRRATCFRPSCLDPGHLASHCPGPQFSRVRKALSEVQEPSELANSMTTMMNEDEMHGTRRCYLCGEEGHTMRNCPRNTRSRTNKPYEYKRYRPENRLNTIGNRSSSNEYSRPYYTANYGAANNPSQPELQHQQQEQ